jgi:hypothetical protein
MADLAPAAGAVFDLIAPVVGPLVKRALAAFAKTTAGMATLGLFAAVGSYLLADGAAWWHGALAAAAALALFAGLGAYLAVQRAVGGALITALGELALGKKLVGALFAQLLRVRETEQHAERGVDAARVAERLPLRQAEALLTNAIARSVAASEAARGPGAWLRRRIERALMERVERLTLARFRDADAAEGGVDLVKVRDELAERVDEAAADQVRAMMTRVTLLAVGGAGLGAVLIALAVRRSLGQP